MTKLLRILPSLSLGLFLTACTMVGPDFVTPQAEVNTDWLERGSGLRGDMDENREWWRLLQSPTLDQLVETAYQNNPNLQIAGLRVLQAQAQLNVAIGEQYPQQQALSGSANFQYADTGLLNSNTDFETRQIGVGATWEIDFWGKYRRGIEADQATLFSDVAAYDDALVTLIAGVADAFVAARNLDEQRAVLESNAADQREGLRIARVRFENGETSALDVSQAETRLAETEAQIPGLQQQWQQSANNLSLLLGEPPGYADALLKQSRDMPVAPSQVDVGIPRDLLRRRPDVRQALLTAAAQSAVIGVAESNRYPAFSLSGFFGFGTTSIGNSSHGNLFNWNSRALQAGASFMFPIFNYGRLRNQVRVEDAAFQQTVLNYQNTVIAAQQDVENALATYVYGKQTTAALERAAQSAQRTSELAMVEYKDGQVGYTALLTAYDSQLQVENALVKSRGQVLAGLISVYRALGGGWQMREGQDIVPEPIAEQMRQRTNWGDVLPANGFVAPGPANSHQSSTSVGATE